jgi:hypothetical protein
VVISDEAVASKARVKQALKEFEVITREVQDASTSVHGVFEELTGKSPLDISKERGEGERDGMGGSAARSKRDIKLHIQSLRVALLERLDAREAELIAEVTTALDNKTNILSSEIDSLSLYVASNYSIGLRTKHFMDQHSDIDIMEQEGALLHAMSEQMRQLENLPKAAGASSVIEYSPLHNDTFLDLVQGSISQLGRVENGDIDATHCVVQEEGNNPFVCETDTESTLTVLTADSSGVRSTFGGALLAYVVVSDQSSG